MAEYIYFTGSEFGRWNWWVSSCAVSKTLKLVSGDASRHTDELVWPYWTCAKFFHLKREQTIMTSLEWCQESPLYKEGSGYISRMHMSSRLSSGFLAVDHSGSLLKATDPLLWLPQCPSRSVNTLEQECVFIHSSASVQGYLGYLLLVWLELFVG